MPINRSSPVSMACLSWVYEGGMSIRLASWASFLQEWASECETRVSSSILAICLHILGSADKPVSTAESKFLDSPKASSRLLKPDFEPNMANHGVQMWAGINMVSELACLTILRSSSESRPRIGRPSDLRLPMSASLVLILATVVRSGATMRL